VTGPRTVLNASGYVVARREATVSSKLTGKVVDVLIEEGMEVEEGQVLARLDDANLRARVELAQAQVNAARGGLLETQVRLEEAERTGPHPRARWWRCQQRSGGGSGGGGGEVVAGAT
jgi:multidrug efflux pump subunit AcrA (membrane-fusion protein)